MTFELSLRDQMRMVQRDSAGYALWQTPVGHYWMPAGSRDALAADLSEQHREIYGGEQRVRPGDVVLDCGANIGLFTQNALAKGAKLVVAIEPAPNNLECLRRNLAREIGEKRVIVYPKGVWDKDDVLPMNIDPMNSAADSFVTQGHREAGAITLPLTTIDKLVEELHLPRVDFVKMDIEGAEKKAIAGARQTIRRFRPRMAICLYHEPDDPERIPALVKGIDSRYRMECDCLYGATEISPKVGKFAVD